MSILPRCTTHLPLHQLFDIAKGLNYLHSYSVVHGDLQGVRGCLKFHFATVLTLEQSNIIVDVAGHHARITDFGLAVATQNLDPIQDSPAEHEHGPRWTAPEILDRRKTYNKEGDVFSFAMVMIEVRCRRPTRS